MNLPDSRIPKRVAATTLSAALALGAIYLTQRWLYYLNCRSMGGSIQDSVCRHPVYNELFYQPSLPFYLLLTLAGLLCFTMTWLPINKYLAN